MKRLHMFAAIATLVISTACGDKDDSGDTATEAVVEDTATAE
jgi:hypothetical protein